MPDPMGGRYGGNLTAAPVSVRHDCLARVSLNGDFKVYCPACNHGILMVNRDQETLEVIDVDRCTACGQLIFYTDDVIAGHRVKHLDKTPSGRVQNPPPAPLTAWDRLDKLPDSD
jgi:DNA-directed RNA polymerase subunit RPC12/RpoP